MTFDFSIWSENNFYIWRYLCAWYVWKAENKKCTSALHLFDKIKCIITTIKIDVVKTNQYHLDSKKHSLKTYSLQVIGSTINTVMFTKKIRFLILMHEIVIKKLLSFKMCAYMNSHFFENKIKLIEQKQILDKFCL